ncbi:STAS domain-containing protein [Streptomyces sp. NPDC017524]|uniref:STAS domain-containing protein n=1 Tax=unclassified Streptomyces TaxID=2593676 RepID=UPI0037A4E76F
MEPFTVHARTWGDVVLITPCGPLDHVTRTELDSLCFPVPGVHAVILDMAHVPSMSDDGLRLLDRLLTYGAEYDVHVVTVGWQAQPLRVLGNRADHFVPPPVPRPMAPHGAVPEQLLRDLQARALRAMALGVSSGDAAAHRHQRPPS